MSKTVDSHVALVGSSCAELTQEWTALRIWKISAEQRISPEKAVAILPKDIQAKCVTNPGDGQVSLDVSDAIPDFLSPRMGTCAAADGPNCFNTALVSSGLVPVFRHSTAQEINFWITSPLCRAVKSGEPRMPGDLIYIHGKGTGAIHAMTYISPTLVFSKNGMSKTAEWALGNSGATSNSYLKMYRDWLDPKAAANPANKNSPTPVAPQSVSPCEGFTEPDPSYEKCNPQMNLYRCMSVTEYLRDKPQLRANFECMSQRIMPHQNIISEAYLNKANPKEGCPVPSKLAESMCGIFQKNGANISVIKSCGSQILDQALWEQTYATLMHSAIAHGQKTWADYDLVPHPPLVPAPGSESATNATHGPKTSP